MPTLPTAMDASARSSASQRRNVRKSERFALGCDAPAAAAGADVAAAMLLLLSCFSANRRGARRFPLTARAARLVLVAGREEERRLE